MQPYIQNIEKETLENEFFRKEVFTGKYLQMTLMTLQPGEEIGAEIHGNIDQFLRIEQGSGRALIGETEYDVSDDWAIIVPAGMNHNVVNTGDVPLKLYSIYTPPEHPQGTIHKTKAEADAAHAEHHHD
jgi:mannose-6-phosphate isomerase-like protein (cupin superfamily)